MPEAPSPAPDVDALVRRLRARVEERRLAGQYPAGLEADLDRHFEMAVAASLRTRADLVALIAHVREAAERINPDHISTVSSVPLGSSVHRTIAKVVHRQVEGALQQVKEYTATVQTLLDTLVTQELPDIVARVDAVMERLAAYERLPEATDDTSRALAARVERLEKKIAELTAKPAVD